MSIAILTLGIAAALIGMGLTLGCCWHALGDLLKRWRTDRERRLRWRRLIK